MLQKKRKGLACFDADIMSSISDKFAHMHPDKNDPMDQSYFGVNKEEENIIYTPPKDKPIGKIEQKRIMDNVNAKREQQNNEFIQHSNQIQMELIMQNEHDRQQPGYVDINRQTQNIPKKGITLKSNRN